MSDHETRALAELDRRGRRAATALHAAVRSRPGAGVGSPTPDRFLRQEAPDLLRGCRQNGVAGGDPSVPLPVTAATRRRRRPWRTVAVVAAALALVALAVTTLLPGTRSTPAQVTDGGPEQPAPVPEEPVPGPVSTTLPGAGWPLSELEEGDVVVAEGEHDGDAWRLAVNGHDELTFEMSMSGLSVGPPVDDDAPLAAASSATLVGADGQDAAVFGVSAGDHALAIERPGRPAVPVATFPVAGTDRWAFVGFVPDSLHAEITGGVVARAADGTELASAPVLPPATTTDAELEDLRAACAIGSLDDCDDLWLGTPIGSELEAFAETCGGRDPAGGHQGTCADDLGP